MTVSNRHFNARERFILRLTAFNRCESCGCELTHAFHADHKTAFSRGGPTTLGNGQALCPRCNLKKGTKQL
jgi:hypothetical protein